MKYSEILNIALEKNYEIILNDRATKEAIEKFEKDNGITLPNRYKEWLLFSDGGDLFSPGGVQLYGVEHKPLIDINENDRPSDDYIVIGVLSMGDPILFKKDNEQIYIYSHESMSIEEDETYDNFDVFLSHLVNILGLNETEEKN